MKRDPSSVNALSALDFDQGVKTTDTPAFAGVKLNNLTIGKIPTVGTAKELVDGQTPLAGTKVYYASDSSGGTVNRKLTFINGILVGET